VAMKQRSKLEAERSRGARKRADEAQKLASRMPRPQS
jgi:hypothetical protein